jgi:hypothetical protein
LKTNCKSFLLHHQQWLKWQVICKSCFKFWRGQQRWGGGWQHKHYNLSMHQGVATWLNKGYCTMGHKEVEMLRSTAVLLRCESTQITVLFQLLKVSWARKVARANVHVSLKNCYLKV